MVSTNLAATPVPVPEPAPCAADATPNAQMLCVLCGRSVKGMSHVAFYGRIVFDGLTATVFGDDIWPSGKVVTLAEPHPRDVVCGNGRPRHVCCKNFGRFHPGTKEPPERTTPRRTSRRCQRGLHGKCLATNCSCKCHEEVEDA